MQRRRGVAAALWLVLGACGPASAIFAGLWETAPVSRLITNVQARIKAKPNDAEAHYLLGRLHSLVFARGVDAVGWISRGKREPGFPPYDSILVPPPKPRLSPAQVDHLARSIECYNTAVKLDPANPLYLMGLGWMREQGLPFVGDLPGVTQADAPRVRSQWRAEALRAYRAAYAKSREGDLKLAHLGPGTNSAVSLEAGEGLVRLLKQSTDPAELRESAEVARHVEIMSKKPRAITPIIFPLGSRKDLRSLLTARTVRFDLNGDGQAERWPWVGPETGILVWDPRETGRITSGRQLFGSATWSMFFRSGYAALESLDDNRDGWLSGPELSGIGVWRDRNTNGRSDAGEVRPARYWEIRRIAVRPDTPGTLRARYGIELTGERRLPSFDWVPRSR